MPNDILPLGKPKKPQKVGGPKIYEAFHPSSGDKQWTCWQKADGETTRGWGPTPHDAYFDWLYRTLIAEGAGVQAAMKQVRENPYA